MITLLSLMIERKHADELGHMNHVAAIRMLEHARHDWYHQAGLWCEENFAGSLGLGTVVVNLNINFMQECFEGETLQIKTNPLYKGTKSYVLLQQMVRPAGEIAVKSRCTSVIMDLGIRQVIPVPESIGIYFPDKSQEIAFS